MQCVHQRLLSTVIHDKAAGLQAPLWEEPPDRRSRQRGLLLLSWCAPTFVHPKTTCVLKPHTELMVIGSPGLRAEAHLHQGSRGPICHRLWDRA